MSKGLRVNVMGSDCTNGGVTSGKSYATLIGPGIPEIFEADEDAPALYLHYDLEPTGLRKGCMAVASWSWLQAIGRTPNGNTLARVIISPDEDTEGGMFGGNHITCSDSRFPFETAVKVFDRFE